MDPQAFAALPDEALVRRDVAAQLTGGQSASTIARWAAAGRYPKPIRIGAIVLVRVSDLRDWLMDPEGYAERQKAQEQEPLA